jgi:hypothetical protein
MRKEILTRTPVRATRWLALATLALTAAACSGDKKSPTENNSGGECDVATPAGTITLGQTINGSLTGSDCLAPDGSRADLYRLTIQEPTHVSMLMQSTAFDAYIVLLDADGDVIGEDDDSAGGSNAGLSGVLNAGTYYVAANSAAAGESGAYSLTVDEL